MLFCSRPNATTESSHTPIMTMNVDCWLLILGQIPPSERTVLRSVCSDWCNFIDYLAFSQKRLQLNSAASDQQRFASPTTELFSWPHHNISYTEFVRLFQQFSNLRQLTFRSFTHRNDHHLIRLTELCKSIEKLAFYSCPHLGDNYFNDFGFHNVTQIGWQTLALHYNVQLHTLILEDCDLENYHLNLIVQSFHNVRHLNVSNNSEITNFSCLKNLPPSIEVLKLGPKLSVNCRRNRALYNYEMPIDEILAGNGRNIHQLQLQGCLTSKLARLQQLTQLKQLIIKYASFSTVEDVFNLEVEILISAMSKLKQLRHLELYQINQSSSMDLHWLRQRLTSNSISTTHKSSLLPNLHSFSLFTIDPLIVVDQFKLIDFVLSSTPNLRSFSLSCSTFDSDLHYNLNQTILVLLQKYGHKLRELKLENLFPTGLYSYLAYVVLTSQNLVKFIMEDREMATLLCCMDMQIDQLLTNGKLKQDAIPLDLIFTVPEPKKAEWNQQHMSREYFNYLNDFVRIHFRIEQCDHSLKSAELSLAESVTESQLTSDEHDLSDLCQLIDSSCDLVGHFVDLVSVCTNYLCLTMACAMLLRPSHLAHHAKRWLLARWHFQLL